LVSAASAAAADLYAIDELQEAGPEARLFCAPMTDRKLIPYILKEKTLSRSKEKLSSIASCLSPFLA
jgi:hypothetical protein